MKILVKDNFGYLFVSVVLIIGGIVVEPLLAILGLLIGITCVLATGMERSNNAELVQDEPVQQREYRNLETQVSYSSF